MKKVILISVSLVIALLTSCTVPKNETVPEAVDEIIEKEIDDKVDEELIDDEIEQNGDDVTENKDGTDEIKIDTGRFNGLSDANFFEVKISGVPDSIPPKMFMLTDDVREKFQNLNLQQDDEIKLHYYENTDGHLIVTDIEKISQ